MALIRRFIAVSALCSVLCNAQYTWPYQIFKTATFHPPVLNITTNGKLSPGYLFFAPDGPPAHNIDGAPMIMDMSGELIWNGPIQHAFGFGVQTYQGTPVLVAWNGSLFPDPVGRGNGEVLLWNNNYQVVNQVMLAGNFLETAPGVTYPSNVDCHEQYVTPQGTMIVTGNNVTQTDLTSVGGPANGWVVEAQVYEIDIATNEILFSWKSLDHLDTLPVNLSVYPLGSDGQDGLTQPTAWGYFHINSAKPFDDGYILSSRYLSSAIAIDKSGNVLWRLSGVDGGDFTLGDGVMFKYQHDIRVLKRQADKSGQTTKLRIHLHDNENSSIENGTIPTSGKTFDMNFQTKLVTLYRRYINDASPLYAVAQGNSQILPNGHVFEGNGFIPILQEFSPNGDVTLAQIQFGSAPPRDGGGFNSYPRANTTLSYRAFKHPWIGCPQTQPAVVAQAGSPGTTVYVSWNGATEVTMWKVYDGTTMKLLKTVKKKGFETTIQLSKNVTSVQVAPVLRKGAPENCGQGVNSGVITVS